MGASLVVSPSVASYLASIAVTSTSIAILGHANWLTTRNVEAGIGALPKASATFQCVLKEANVRRVGHYSYNIVHRRVLRIEQFLDFHVSVPALLHEVALMNDFSITLAFRANSSKKNELSWICNSHYFRELSLRPFIVIEVPFLKIRCALSNGKCI